MASTRLRIMGALLLATTRHEDERGSFARVWDRAELSELGVAADFVQVSLSENSRRGTLRGLHYQAPPGGEAKLITCVAGAIWDVIVDLRPNSPTFREGQ